MGEIHIVGVSGGKDSTALALRLKEISPQDYIYICTPTGDELPEMEMHWRRLGILLGKPLLRLGPGYDLKECFRRNKGLPNWRMRFCTPDLKIKPCQEWINRQASAGHDVTLYIGLRADEEGREGGIYDNCSVRFPFRDWGWSLAEIRQYLCEKGVDIPRRTDCARCFFQTLPEWWMLWREHPEIFEDAVQDEVAFGHTFRSPSRDTWPASLAELRNEFESGRLPRGMKAGEDGIDFSANKCRVCSL